MQTKMKRTLPYILLIFTLFLTGCDWDSMHLEEGEKDCIVLYFSAAGKDALTPTKASTISGVTGNNENLITSVDCFFYPDDGTGSNAVMSAIGRTADPVVVNGNPSDVLYKVTIRYNATQAMDIFRSLTDGTGRVFVIANASISYDDGRTSVADLKQKLIERDFSVQQQQGSFVMYSEDDEDTTEGYPITLSGGTVTGRIPMDRVAAKVQVFLDIPEYLEDTNTDKLWVPDLDHVRAFLANGMKRTRIQAPYTPAADGSDYFSFDYREVYDLRDRLDPGDDEDPGGVTDDEALYNGLTTAEKAYPFTSYPFYSYPCTWTDFHDHGTVYIIDIPWSIADENMNPTGDPESRYYQVSANTVASTLERNHYYRTFVRIESLGGVDLNEAVVITDCSYKVIPWTRRRTDSR